MSTGIQPLTSGGKRQIEGEKVIDGWRETGRNGEEWTRKEKRTKRVERRNSEREKRWRKEAQEDISARV